MTLLLTAEELSDLLDLEPLPIEGGFFRQTYVVHGHPQLGSADPQVSAIFYLVTPEAYSALHRLRSDQMFHFSLGDTCSMVACDQSGTLDRITMRHDMRVQQLVPAGSWQGLRLRDGGRFALLGTTMSPGFRPDSFELAEIDDVDGFASDVRESLLPFLAPSRPAP